MKKRKMKVVAVVLTMVLSLGVCFNSVADSSKDKVVGGNSVHSATILSKVAASGVTELKSGTGEVSACCLLVLKDGTTIKKPVSSTKLAVSTPKSVNGVLTDNAITNHHVKCGDEAQGWFTYSVATW